MSSAAIPRVPREQELIAEVRAYLNGASRIAPRDTHLLACLVRMDDAIDAQRLATEALEAKDRELGELLEQLTAERARRIALELEVEDVDRAVADVILFASEASNRSAQAKRVVAKALYPEPAGSGAGVR